MNDVVQEALPYRPESASQTAGPFVHIGLMPQAAGRELTLASLGRHIAGSNAPGEHIVITGRVIDGAGAAVNDMVIEIWQADNNGVYPSPDDARHGEVAPEFGGFGRVCTDAQGDFRIDTVKPGVVPPAHAPHLNLCLLARGVNIGLTTRLYFDDEKAANAADPVLGLVAPRQRIDTLLAQRTGSGTYTFDIHLQGDKETVFLDV